MRENPGKMPQNSGVFGGGAAPQADEEASAGCAGRAGLGALHHLRPRDCERAFAETPSFYPLEQRQREDKARREQADAEQQAGQEQAERVHGERIPGLELNEHQRWVRTGFRRSPLRGDRALGSDHATKANTAVRAAPAQDLAAAVANQSTKSERGPGTGPTDCTLRPQRPAMSVKRGSRRLGCRATLDSTARQAAGKAERQPFGLQLASLGRDSPRQDSATRSLTGGQVRWSASPGCLNATLRQVIAEVSAQFGPVSVNSTCRSRQHNASVGGAPHSQHLSGNAVDFKCRSQCARGTGLPWRTSSHWRLEALFRWTLSHRHRTAPHLVMAPLPIATTSGTASVRCDAGGPSATASQITT